MTPVARLLRRPAPRLAWRRVEPATVVRVAFFASAALLVGLVARYANPVPIHDEFSNIGYLFADPPAPWKAYWAQHNEHRIPLPRVLYVVAVRATGYDFRAPPYLNVALLVAGTAALLAAVRRVRGGRYAYADAAIPLGLLTVGQYSNLLWGFQVQFITSVVLVLVALALAVGPDLAASRRRLAGLGLCGVLLPLCGANGVAFAPGLGLALLLVGGWNVWSRGADKLAGVIAAAGGAATLAVLGAYFRGLESPAHHSAGVGTPAQAVAGFVNLLGMSFGPVARWLPLPFVGVSVLGVAAAGLVAATAWRLGRAALDPAERPRALVLGGILVGFLGLAIGIARSRAGFAPVLDVNRYVSLMLPMLAGAYAAWAALGAVVVPRAVVAAVLAAAVPNLADGVREAPLSVYYPREIVASIKGGMPLEFVADRYVGLYYGEPGHRRDMLALLREKGVEPFRSAVPLPALREEVVPVRVLRAEAGVADGTGFRVTGPVGHLVLEVPRGRTVYGVKITYRATAGTNPVLPNVVSWEPDGRPPVSAAGGMVNQLEPRATPTESLFYLRRELGGTLRIDLFGEGARFDVTRLALLTAPD